MTIKPGEYLTSFGKKAVVRYWGLIDPFNEGWSGNVEGYGHVDWHDDGSEIEGHFALNLIRPIFVEDYAI